MGRHKRRTCASRWNPGRAACLLLLALASWSGHAYAQQSDTAGAPVFRSLEEALRQPDQVLRIDLSDQHLGHFPMELLRMKNLRELRLRNDDLRELPPEIGGLVELRVLDLSGNPLTLLPATFGELRELEELIINDNPSFDLNKDLRVLTGLPRLRVLHLENDGLRELPAAIGELKELRELYLGGNQLRSIGLDLQRLQRLELIDLHDNPMPPTVPDDLRQRGVLLRF